MVDVYGKLVKVGSEEDLESGDATFRLGFRLPTDDLVYCNVGPDVVNRLHQYGRKPIEAGVEGRSGGSVSPVPPPTKVVAVTQRQKVEEHALNDQPLPDGVEPAPMVEEYGTAPTDEVEGDSASSEEVDWMALPESALPEHVKTAMSAMRFGEHQLPDKLVITQVVSIRDAILAEYSADDWAKLGYDISEEQQPTEQVLWEPGQPIQPKFVPQRRITRVDAKGNPIVRPNPNDVDPGELVAADDEDGTDQF